MTSVWDVREGDYDGFVGTFATEEEAWAVVRAYNALKKEDTEAYVEERPVAAPGEYEPCLMYTQDVYVRRNGTTRTTGGVYRVWQREGDPIRIKVHANPAFDSGGPWYREDDVLFTVLGRGYDGVELAREVAKEVHKCIDKVNEVKERQ